MGEFILQDMIRSPFQNQISETGLTGKTLNDADRIYVITEIVASAGGTLSYINGKGEMQSKTIDTGRREYHHPVVGRNIVMSAEVTEYAGYYFKV